MKNSFSKKQIGLAVACALALGLMSGAARAQSAFGSSGWAQDSRGTVVHSGTGLCVRSGTPAVPNSALACDSNSQKLTFDADTLFDFDKSTLRPSGRRTLDNFVDSIKGINPETIMVVGHASRPGTEQYNQRLSEERAQSVKAYLVSSGIAPYRVRTSGKGETQPVTFAGECLSDMSAKAIACTQPDRHVDIELIGARIPR